MRAHYSVITLAIIKVREVAQGAFIFSLPLTLVRAQTHTLAKWIRAGGSVLLSAALCGLVPVFSQLIGSVLSGGQDFSQVMNTDIWWRLGKKREGRLLCLQLWGEDMTHTPTLPPHPFSDSVGSVWFHWSLRFHVNSKEVSASSHMDVYTDCTRSRCGCDFKGLPSSKRKVLKIIKMLIQDRRRWTACLFW